MASIYLIENLLSNKKYVGQTKQRISQRIYQHFNQAKKGTITPLYNALRKYTRADFKISCIEKCPPELLDEREEYWIQHYNAYKEGYNCDKGGGGITGYNHSQETKDKISASHKGLPSHRKGKKGIHTAEANRKRSETLKKSYRDGTRKPRDYSDISGENNGNYKTGKYLGEYARYKKKQSA